MSEKQFPPSTKRLTKLKKEGKTIKTQLVSMAVTYWVAALVLPVSLSWVRNRTLIQWLNYEVWEPEAAFWAALVVGGRSITLLIAALAGGALAAELLQSRGRSLPSLILQGFHRYQPGSVVGRFKQSISDISLGLARCAVLVVVVAPVFGAVVSQSGLLLELQSHQAREVFSDFVRSVVLRGGAVITVVAAVAYSWARWRFYQQHRMSLQELREEHREGEGDPHLKSARKHEHMVLVLSELERRVKRSRVVVVRRAQRSPRAQ